MDLRQLTLADFYQGHDTDPLMAPDLFTDWRRATQPEQSLFRRPLLSAAGPRTRLEGPRGPVEVLNFASLDYLGINRHPEVAQAVKDAVDEWGSGACGVPMLTGTSQLHCALEADVASHTGRDSGIIFPTGFAGGVAIMSALLHRGDVAIADEKAHMCWMDGISQSGARLVTFAHGDVEDLARKLEQHASSRRLVVVDALYSMDGDVSDLPSLLDVCDAHGVGLVVDEAHSIFALGAQGGGLTEMQGVEDRVRLLFGTFSKALSQVGGFAAGNRELLDYTRMFGHPFTFSSALPPAVVAGIRAAMSLVRREGWRRQQLADNAAYFRKGVAAMGLSTGKSSTHVVPIMVGRERELLYAATLSMLERGLYVVPIDFPAVPEDGLRLRVAITAAHSREDLDTALNIIEDGLGRELRRSSSRK
jgi:glycine C-acetyltransferase